MNSYYLNNDHVQKGERKVNMFNSRLKNVKHENIFKHNSSDFDTFNSSINCVFASTFGSGSKLPRLDPIIDEKNLIHLHNP